MNNSHSLESREDKSFTKILTILLAKNKNKNDHLKNLPVHAVN
jgi:hypothetical protein